MNKWKFSPALESVILNHHRPEALSPEDPLLLFLDLGNMLCHKLGIGFLEEPDLDVAGSAANEILGLPPESFEATAEKLQETLETEMEIFI